MNIRHNIELQPYNSFRTKAVARLFAEPESGTELSGILRNFPQERKLILGAGYNIFFTKDFDGLIIRPAMKGITIVKETDRGVELEAAAAEEWDALVEYCVAKGYAGLESLSLIPGSVGASPVQNIGAYGTEVKDVITRVSAVDMETGEVRAFNGEACAFAYRDSIFKRTGRYLITSVTFALDKSFVYKEKYVDLSRELQGIASPTLMQVREAIIRIRTRKLPDPVKLPNAGSFFKNPVLSREETERLQVILPDLPVYNLGGERFKTSAAFLIEKAGYKGKRKGMVGVYEKHSLIIVNYGTENGEEISDFMKEIQQSVMQQFAVALQPEVWIY